MEMILVKFDELTAMASECNNSGPVLNCLNFQDSLDDMNEIPSQQDLDNLFGPLYEEYYEPITSSEEPIIQESLILILETHSDEQLHEDVAELDGNTIMNSFENPKVEESESSSNYQDPSNMHEVLALETTKSNQALEIESLKRRVKSLEKRRKSRTPGFKRLRKVGSASRVESSNDVSLGAQEDASKQGRKIVDLDADAEVTLVDETQEMNDDNLMFDTGVLEEQEKEVAEKEVSAADPVTTAGEVVTTANVEVTTANDSTKTINELTLDRTLIEMKVAKPKDVTSTATTTTTTRPKARGVAKDKGKAKMVEPEKPLKKKDQIAMVEEVARNLEAQLQVELEEEERISRLKEEKANIALLESWDNTQAMIDADF
ncbi:hypothetical protein Tco_1107315 [Tanacetum coccineum]